MRLRFALTCALLPNLLSGVAYNQDFIPKARAKAKEPAPRFNATTTDGEKFSNLSIKGKVILLEFWTTWCSFCAAALCGSDVAVAIDSDINGVNGSGIYGGQVGVVGASI